MSYEEGYGSVSSSIGIEDDDDDENTSNSLKEMFINVQTLISKKHLPKNNVTNMKVAALQSLIVP